MTESTAANVAAIGPSVEVSTPLDGHAFASLKDTLARLDVDHGAADSTQSKCLTKYLGELKTKCCLVEHDYTDSDYLSDYVGYYARCHEPLPKVTKRLHFFTLPLDDIQTLWRQYAQREVDTQSVERQFKDAYVGFVVIRPLPVTVIGRTCLKTYDKEDKDKGRRRLYPITRKYRVHLYGLRLSVRSVAFQQQDKEIAACATAAIWFTMHALPSKFTVSEIPSPYAITSDGWENLIQPPQGGETARKFPAVGLDIKQIDGCLRKHGLECMVSGTAPGETGYLHEHVAAYVLGGYPMIVVSEQYASKSEDSGYVLMGLHAITVLGLAYKLGFHEGLWSERIERIYAHDDGIGPFASFSATTISNEHFERLKAESLVNESVEAIHERIIGHDKKTKLADDHPKGQSKSRDRHAAKEEIKILRNESGINVTGKVYSILVPRYFIIPTHPKVRLPYETVHLLATDIQRAFTRVAPQHCAPDKTLPALSWEVRLEEVSGFKARLPDLVWTGPAERLNVLTKPTARFLWTLLFTRRSDDSGDVPLLMIVFDATSLKQSGGISFVLRNRVDPLAETLRLSIKDFFTEYLNALAHQEEGLERAVPDVEVCLPELVKQLTDKSDPR
jgi:hypothetical protein